jgi:hypothetical protein
MLARLRISLPDRPGSLGRVTTTLGTAGADIASVDVLQSESGRALDVFVAVRDLDHLGGAVRAVDALAGVKVLAVQRSVPPVTGHADLELAAQVIDRIAGSPEAALRTLVEGAPGALGADWAALVSFDSAGEARVQLTSQLAPDVAEIGLSSPLRLKSLRVTDRQGRPYAGAALVPLEDSGDGRGLALLLVRAEGPDYHRSELWRLGQLGRVLGLSVGVPA